MKILIVIACILIACVGVFLWGLVLYNTVLVNLKTFVVSVPNDTYTVIARGKRAIRIIFGGDNHYVNFSNGELVDKHNPNLSSFEKSLLKHWGLYWLGWKIGIDKVLPITLDAASLKPESQRKNCPIREWVEHKPKTVNSFRQRTKRIITISDVELADGTKVEVALVGMVRMTNPKTALIDRQGDVYPMIDAGMRGAVSNALKNLSYKAALFNGKVITSLISIQKGNPKDALAIEMCAEANGCSKTTTATEWRETGTLSEQVGMFLETLFIDAYQLSPDSEPFEKAAQAEAIAKEEVKAVIVRGEAAATVVRIDAEAQAAAIIVIKQAEAKGKRSVNASEMDYIKRMTKAYIENGCSPETAAVQVGQQLWAKELSGLTTLVKNGDAQAMINLPIDKP